MKKNRAARDPADVLVDGTRVSTMMDASTGSVKREVTVRRSRTRNEVDNSSKFDNTSI
jgi:hypothetical protein